MGQEKYLHLVTTMKGGIEFLYCFGVICSVCKTLLNFFELLIIRYSYYKRKLKVLFPKKRKLTHPTIIVLWTSLLLSLLRSSGLDCYVLTYGE